MSAKLYLDLAYNNIRRNRRSYWPYLLSCTGLVMMYYVMAVLEYNLSQGGLFGAKTLARTISLGQWVMSFFIVVFLLYTQSFLMKRRQKEFGLFNILGMEKKHISRMLALESLLVGVLSTLAGILLGMLFSRLFYMLMLRSLIASSSFHIMLPWEIARNCLLFFLALHAVTLLKSVVQLRLSQPIALLQAGRQGEREPKTKWLMAVIGLACLGGGYYLSLSTQVVEVHSLYVDPPIFRFFVAVMLVIVGTYLLFMAGSVAGLKLLKSYARFYYKPRHFTVVSGLMFRMRRNAVGLASICILSTMVLVMMSASTSLFATREDVLNQRYHRNTRFAISTAQSAEGLDEARLHLLQSSAEELGGSISNLVQYRESVHSYYADKQAMQQLSSLRPDSEWQNAQVFYIRFVPSVDHAAPKTGTQLQKGQALAQVQGDIALSAELFLDGQPVQLLESAEGLHDLEPIKNSVPEVVYLTLVMAQEEIETILQSATGEPARFHHVYAFDLQGMSHEAINQWITQLHRQLSDLNQVFGIAGNMQTSFNSLALDEVDFNAVYGGIMFVSLMLGALFIMAAVMIIYYKQVSEGYEDQESYTILQKVGMSLEEVRRSIRVQVLMVFFLPLLMAGLHLLMSGRITSAVLQMMGMHNMQLFHVVTGLCFVLFCAFYTFVYWQTTRSYYKIVRTGA